MNRTVLYAFFILIGLSACRKGGFAKVNCASQQLFQSDNGVLNYPNFEIGFLVVLNTQAHSGGSTSIIPISNDMIFDSSETDTLVVQAQTNFSIGLSGTVSKASKNIVSQIESSINNNTDFILVNCKRVTLKNPLELVSQPNYVKRIQGAIGNSDHLLVMLVTSVVRASSFSMKARQAVKGDAGVEVLKVGKFDVEVQYDCNSWYRVVGLNRPGIFYKASFFTLSEDKKSVIPYTNNIDLSKYSFNLATY